MTEALRLGWRQYRLERRMFWRNPSAAFFNFLLPLVILLAGGAILSGKQHDLNKLLPAIAGMSVMSTTFTALAYNIVYLRERGVLKRIRGAPLPTGSYFGGVAANAVTNTALQIALVVLTGRLLFGIGWPPEPLSLIAWVLVGVVAFAALGVAFAHAIPNFESTAAYVNAVFLPVVILSFYVFDASNPPGLPEDDRRRAAAAAADRRPVRSDGDRLADRRAPRRAGGDRPVGSDRDLPGRQGFLLGARVRSPPPITSSAPNTTAAIIRPAQRKTASPSEASIASSTSALSVTPEAAAFSWTCSGRLAPMIAEATLSIRRTQASASWAIVRPASSAIGRRPSTASSTLSRIRPPMKPFMLSLAARESCGGAWPGWYLPVSTPWASGDHTICEIPFPFAQRDQLLLRAPPEHRVLGLAGDERSTPGQGQRLGDPLRRPLAEADVAGLPFPHDLGERLHRLLERRVVVVAMALVEVDVICLQPLQGGVDLLVDLPEDSPRSVSDIGK